MNIGYKKSNFCFINFTDFLICGTKSHLRGQRYCEILIEKQNRLCGIQYDWFK